MVGMREYEEKVEAAAIRRGSVEEVALQLTLERPW
jgi:hypothetical protein